MATAGRQERPPEVPPGVVVLQVHRLGGDTWHRFERVEDAAAFALALMRGVLDASTYPSAIWLDGKKLWRPYGRHGKLHIASTQDALASLSGGAGDKT